MAIWTIRRSTAKAEIGDAEFDRLKLLHEWLFPDENGLEFRTAPSLIARSEVELFNISMPRFAFRAYLTASSFVNVRRIETFRKLATSWGLPPHGEKDQHDSTRDDLSHLSDMIRKSSCIGDSLLELPARFREQGYKVLSTELGRAYGENDEITGTPFVNHIKLGGGMCAQAVCFMATALHQRIARGIHGVAEITALGSDARATTLEIGGMTPTRVCQYFNHARVGLSALREEVPIENDNLEKNAQILRGLLRSYLLSDVPVIARVDFGRMCGVQCKMENGTIVRELNNSHIFSHQGLPDGLRLFVEDCQARKPKLRHHAVLIVGCRANGPDQNDEAFLVNDPASYPFLRVSTEELIAVRQYHSWSHKKVQLGENIEFISVTPQEVQLPLMGVGRKELHEMGLMEIASSVIFDKSSPTLPWSTWPTAPESETRLVDLRCCRRQEEDEGENKRLGERLDGTGIPPEAQAKLGELVRAGKIPAKSCWVHYGPGNAGAGEPADSLWVWDATIPPPPRDQRLPDQLRKKYLLAVLVGRADGWAELDVRPKALRPALISSFLTRSIANVKAWWPDQTARAVDLYALMQPEVDEWLAAHDMPEGPPNGPSHQVKVMADCSDKNDAIKEWADSVCREFQSDEWPIVALTSFVPEVTSQMPDPYNNACGAIRFLRKFAEALRERGHSELRTIEVVAGSRMGGVWPKQGGSYAATRMDEKHALRRLISVLSHALRDYPEHDPNDRISFAIELEPGPMYLLRDWESLLRLCAEIEADPILPKFVGVNLDIAHWRLAGDITPEMVWDTAEVRNRIVHAHISGHHRSGHLGDLPLQDLNDLEDFRPWIDLLQRIAGDWRDPCFPQYSGYVSLELEAAKGTHVLRNSIAQLAKLV